MKKVLRIFTRIMIVIISIVAILVIVAIVYMQHPKFGASADGARLERIKASPNFKDGSFVNRTFTPQLTPKVIP